MKLNSLATASLLAVCSLGSQAASTDWGAHDLLESALALSSGGLLFDTYSFSLASASNVASSVSSIGTIVPATYGLFSVGGDGLVGTADDTATPFAWNFGGAPVVHNATLAAGSYYYAVFGVALGASAYSINSAAAATPVPEPETYAMLLAGLGVVGFLARRRQSV